MGHMNPDSNRETARCHLSWTTSLSSHTFSDWIVFLSITESGAAAELGDHNEQRFSWDKDVCAPLNRWEFMSVLPDYHKCWFCLAVFSKRRAGMQPGSDQRTVIASWKRLYKKNPKTNGNKKKKQIPSVSAWPWKTVPIYSNIIGHKSGKRNVVYSPPTHA